MINYKLKQKLIGIKNWPRISTVFVKGIPSEPNVLPQGPEEENEKIIQSWKNVVVLKAISNQPTIFYIGYYNKGAIAYLKHEFTTNLNFAMRIGPGDVNFFIFPKDLASEVKLEMVEQTTEDDPKYPDLILI